MARKGQFKKGGGRVGASHHTKRRKSHTTTAVAHRPRTHTVHKTKYRTRTVVKRSRGKSGGGIKLLHLAGAAAVLGFVTSDNHGIATVKEYGAKIPGAATFGTPAAIGITALAIDKFVKPNRWLKLFGYAGIVLAAVKAGSQGTDFKFVGDNEYPIGDDMGDDD